MPILLRAFGAFLALGLFFGAVPVRAQTAAMMAGFTGIPLAVYEKLSQRATNGTTLRAAGVQPLIDRAAQYKIIPQRFGAEDLIFPPVMTK